MLFSHLIVITISIFICNIGAELVTINQKNHDDIMKSNWLMFVSFTAEWCPYSRQLLENFNLAAKGYEEKYPESKTVWGNVDCVQENQLASTHSISKYPTMKVYFYGYFVMEYRMSRTPEALIEFVNRMEDINNIVTVTEILQITEWQANRDPIKSTIIIWFPRNSPNYDLMLRAAGLVADRVKVLVPPENMSLKTQHHSLMFSIDRDQFEEFPGDTSNFTEIAEWIKQQSSILVRELSYENAEELVEEGKPFLVLFRDPAHKLIDYKYMKAIRRELHGSKLEMNILITNGNIVHYPLQKIGKSPKDMPILALDSFVHMFLAPFSGDQIFEAGNIRKFVDDFGTGKLHRRFHGQEVEEPPTHTQDPQIEVVTIESAFKKLEPAKNRYSFAKQEL